MIAPNIIGEGMKANMEVNANFIPKANVLSSLRTLL